MPLGQIIAQAVAQIVMEGGSEAIKSRYGLKGCLVALAIVVAIFVGAWWYFTG